ncbi:MAG: glycosyl transferase family 1 [Pirellulaceae bacterium]|nr:MAG: glycosyl transferase family 1 [Pirellulaceae bacterium]
MDAIGTDAGNAVMPLMAGDQSEATARDGSFDSAPSSRPRPLVLHLINGEHFSGAERVQQLLGQRLPEYGFRAEFACLKPGRFRQCSGLPGELIHDFPMHSRADLRVATRLIEFTARSGVELMHAHTPRTALIAATVSLRLGLPWVYHVHSPTLWDSTRRWINRFNHAVEWVSLRRCTHLITVSRSLRRYMLRRGMSRQRITVVPNGVPAIDPIDAAARQNQRQWRLGLIALMRPRKGVEVALTALQQLRQRGHAVSLDLIGGFETAKYRAHIEAMIHALQIREHVNLQGFAQDVGACLRELDVLLLPSLFGEGMPMVVLEALSAGVPVVATRVEGTPEVVRHGREGRLAVPGSATSLAAEVAEVLASRQRWMAMSHAAVERHRECFSDQHMARGVARVYHEVLHASAVR